MSENVILWIFGILIGGIYAVVAAFAAFMISTVQRLAKLETISSFYSERVATILHSPHTPEMDALLEAFQEEYLKRRYELSVSQWQRLAELTEQIVNDRELPKGERLLAAWINSICAHKLLKEPPLYKKTV